jgi:hypothetical protein
MLAKPLAEQTSPTSEAGLNWDHESNPSSIGTPGRVCTHPRDRITSTAKGSHRQPCRSSIIKRLLPALTRGINLELEGSLPDLGAIHPDRTPRAPTGAMEQCQDSRRSVLPLTIRSHPGGIVPSGSPYGKPSGPWHPRIEPYGCMIFDPPNYILTLTTFGSVGSILQP